MKMRNRFAGRPIKPFQTGMTFALAAVAWQYRVFVVGPGSALTDDLSGIFAIAASILLISGWWFRNRQMERWGLMIASGIWIGRAFLASSDPGFGFSVISGWVSLCWAIGSIGTWLLETTEVPVVRKDHSKAVDDE